MLKPLDVSDLDLAVDLLCEGFPDRPAEWWRAALDRMQRYGGNREADYPIGFLLVDGDAAAGIILTPAGLRMGPGGVSRLIVNTSSWYVRPAYRFRAVAMLRALFGWRNAVFTDLSPSPEVTRMMPFLGFEQIALGFNIDVLPQLALRTPFAGRVRAFAPGDPVPQVGPSRAMIEAHRALGCLPVLLDCDGETQLLVFRHGKVRGLPAVTLVHAQSNLRVRTC